ncbi:amino acid adenylation domain-containing protein [Pseudomonas sp. GM67]|uniref:amino acid adenylation domain-containing protein n=1 Tax=Pseudomonas sp. GM67 TaxID=1144335 RepID=UPI000270C473|nr:amino acid adenylation domain-containing protein [Pseudomonas sp. GM67]EJM79335.1 amino acid adenylation enzyme/thioester reductase family protein [Pseudomonas sp. GM67]
MQDHRPNPTLNLEYCADRPIFMDFLQQAQRSPDAIAVVSHDATCSYRQLEQISHGIASFLKVNGATESDRVVIVSNRCAGLVYAMLGALRAGSTFTVADVAYPPARIGQIIRMLKPSFVLLCGGATVDLDSEHLEAGRPAPRIVSIAENPADSLREFAFHQHALPQVDPAQPAYITFTSGSTGEPKGIVATHAPLVHFIEWHTQRHSLSKDDCFSLLSGLGHDPVYRDVFTPLSIGAKVIVPAQSTVIDPVALAAWIQKNAISIIHLTPPLGRLIGTGATLQGARFNALRYLFWGGDALGISLFEQMCVIAPNAVSVNFYGTTETPQAMAYHHVDPEADNSRIPLGRGIKNAQLLVVNDTRQLVHEGEVGEILIRSPYLAQGYWEDIAQTREKFVVNPFTNVENDICYRTGDLGTYLSDGRVSFLGRGDSQVKIRGHRIELAEIEGALSKHPLIKQCVVLAVNDNAQVRLVAYCVSINAVSTGELREHLNTRLPEYMVPALFVFLDAIPLTPNGKIDRRALPRIAANTEAASNHSDRDLSPLALKLTQAWAEILQVPRIDANLTFVELGGDSLSFVQASMVLEELIGHLPDQWEMTPVHELCGLAGKTSSSKLSIRAMEVPVLLRVISIILIVIGHLHLFSTWSVVGETTVLFLISGISLARFQFQAINERGNVRTLVRSVVFIAVPTILYTLLNQILFDQAHWQTMLLISNWFPPTMMGGFAYWYVEVLLQMIVIIGFVLSFERVRNIIVANPFRCLVLAACALAVADIVISAFLFDASPLYNRVPQHYLAVMVLGMAVHYAHSSAQKWIVSAVAVVVMGGEDLLAIFGTGAQEVAKDYVDIAIPAVLSLIWVKSIPVPGLVARGLALVASSTLFIYLTHFQFQSLARHIVDLPVFAVVFAVVGGIGVAYGWNKVVRFVLVRWSGAGKKSGSDTVERVA